MVIGIGTGTARMRQSLRVQRIAIGDERFVKHGFRTEAGFVGGHNRETQRPIPDHISARHEDIASLVRGPIAFDHAAENELDPVVAAAVLAFGSSLSTALRTAMAAFTDSIRQVHQPSEMPQPVLRTLPCVNSRTSSRVASTTKTPQS
ncbi:hypothetical protein ABIB80_007915 [Bradyrhizobium sp. i1.15.2]